MGLIPALTTLAIFMPQTKTFELEFVAVTLGFVTVGALLGAVAGAVRRRGAVTDFGVYPNPGFGPVVEVRPFQGPPMRFQRHPVAGDGRSARPTQANISVASARRPAHTRVTRPAKRIGRQHFRGVRSSADLLQGAALTHPPRTPTAYRPSAPWFRRGRSLSSVGPRYSYSSSNGSSLTVHRFPSRRYILCCSSRFNGRAPTRPNTAIWLPLSSTARSRSRPFETARAWPPSGACRWRSAPASAAG